jgi:hypothetical protein
MNPELQEAFGFKASEVVQMLVETSGQDADDNELTFPVGALAIIDRIERLNDSKGIAFTLAIEGKIVNVFDEGDGLPDKAFFEQVITTRCATERPSLSRISETWIPIPTRRSSTGKSLRATMKLAICRICCALPGH